MASTTSALVRFARLVAAEADPERVLQVLVDRAVEDVGADGAAVFAITPEGEVRLGATRGLPLVPAGVALDSIGPELGDLVRAASGDRLSSVHVLSLISGGDLFGALVLGVELEPLDPARLELAQGLADLAAVAARTAAQLQDLRRGNAELRATREALSRAEKLGALGHMAAGIAHDLGNVLGPLVGDVENMRARSAGDERAGRSLARMARYLQVGRDLCERLRRFARQTPEAGHAALDPSAALRDAVELCATRGRQASAPVDVRLELGAVPRVVVSPSDLTSALVNLINNGIDAQPQGGSVVVRAATSAGGGARIEVLDAGPGIPVERRTRIFEPFFTTKGERGTGLGLANVYAFVQRHRGSIGFECPPGGGTTFALEFPPGGAAGG